MEKVKLIHDKVSNTLTVWIGDPHDEHVCEETSDEIILIKDKKGKVIGFEFLHYHPKEQADFSVETMIKQAANG